MYIYQHKQWPKFTWDHEVVMPQLATVRHLQGRLTGKMETLGFRLKEEASLETLTQNVLKSNEIEGELLNPEQVRSSLARRLGINIPGMVPSTRNVDGVVQMMVDAVKNYRIPLTQQRLFNWHKYLFPEGTSGAYKIVTGKWRNDSTGPMQVVSGAMGKERVHFQAPAAKKLTKEMKQFFLWFNNETLLDPMLKSAIAHLWFITIHPFDDGNGRVARAIADLQLARADESELRFYSMSAQIQKERKKYYDVLEQTQKGTLDITLWIQWFLNCLQEALNATEKLLQAILFKARFLEMHRNTKLNDRQAKMIHKLLDGFEGKLTSSKWAKMTKCSADSALRDMQDLINKKILVKESAGGRSTSYELKK